MEKHEQYAALITAQINDMFKEGAENYIDRDDFDSDANATAFFHALANLSPNYIYHILTGNTGDVLDFNHIANKLCFQFSEKS